MILWDCVSNWVESGGTFSHEEGRLTKASCQIKNDGTGVWYQDIEGGLWQEGNNFDNTAPFNFPTRYAKFTCDGNDVVMNYNYESESFKSLFSCQKTGTVVSATETASPGNINVFPDGCIQSGLRATYTCVSVPDFGLFADVAIDLSCP